jgi:hypothetical protein
MTKRGRWWKEKAVEKKMRRKKVDPSVEKRKRPRQKQQDMPKRAGRAACASITAKGGVKSASKTAREAAASCEGSVVEAMRRVEQPRAQLKKQVKDY